MYQEKATWSTDRRRKSSSILLNEDNHSQEDEEQGEGEREDEDEEIFQGSLLTAPRSRVMNPRRSGNAENLDPSVSSTSAFPSIQDLDRKSQILFVEHNKDTLIVLLTELGYIANPSIVKIDSNIHTLMATADRIESAVKKLDVDHEEKRRRADDEQRKQSQKINIINIYAAEWVAQESTSVL